MRLLVTGATGFVGSSLLDRLSVLPDFDVRACLRTAACRLPANVEPIFVADFVNADLQSALSGTQCVIHAAARAHIMKDKAESPLEEYRRINVDATLNLARQAARAGVKRFIFISSIKVNGECTSFCEPYTQNDVPAPADPYGVSKFEAEKGLQELAVWAGMEVVIIRPPLIYGPGVKANFYNMMKWLYKSFPLPLGAIHNKRSLVSLDNLIDLIVKCIDHPAAANQILLVSDGEDISTTELLRRMGAALGRPVRLLPIPSWILEFGAALLGKRAVAQRLCGSLQVDISKTRELLSWSPPVSVDEALRKTADDFLAKNSK